MNSTKQDFEYLRPPSEAFNIKHSDDYISKDEGNQSRRKIFNEVTYSQFEKEKLAEFKKVVKDANVELPMGWNEADFMRYVYSGRFNMERCLGNLKAHMQWRVDPKRGVLSEKAAKMLNDGLVYLSGRDKQYRPIVVLNIYKFDMKNMDIEDFIDLLCFVLEVARQYYFVPGKVENWILIIETNNLSVFNFPFKIFQRITQVTGANYPCTSEKMFITNPSRFFGATWNIAKGMLDPITASKISVLSKSEFSEFLKHIPADQLEVKYGGTLSDPVSYWPPKNTLNKPPYTLDKKANKQMESIDLLRKDKRSQVVDQQQNLDENVSSDDNKTVYYDFETQIWSWQDIQDEEDDNSAIEKYSPKKLQASKGRYSIFANPKLNPKHHTTKFDDSLNGSDSSIASENGSENHKRILTMGTFKSNIICGGPRLKPNKFLQRNKTSGFGY